MLTKLDPLLTPELLQVLALMGHGDEVAVVDANFPADSVARGTCHGQAVALAGPATPQVVRAILSVLPLDEYVDAPVRAMAAPTTDGVLPPVQQGVQEIVDTVAGRHWPLGALEHFTL